MTSKKVIVIGTGGHAKVIADIILKNNDTLLGFFDKDPVQKHFLGYPVLGNDSDYIKYPDCYFIIAVGNPKKRENIYKNLKSVKWYNAIHPSAVISNIGVTIGVGTVVMANAVINSNASIGKHCIINTSSTIEHDNLIGDFSHVSVGANIGGGVNIGKYSWVGIGASVINNLSVCDNCMIGAGAVVVKNIEKAGTYIGVPAKYIHA